MRQCVHWDSDGLHHGCYLICLLCGADGMVTILPFISQHNQLSMLYKTCSVCVLVFIPAVLYNANSLVCVSYMCAKLQCMPPKICPVLTISLSLFETR